MIRMAIPLCGSALEGTAGRLFHVPGIPPEQIASVWRGSPRPPMRADFPERCLPHEYRIEADAQGGSRLTFDLAQMSFQDTLHEILVEAR